MAVTAIQRVATRRFVKQIFKRDDMRRGKVADMDIVAYASAVGSRIITAEHRDVGA